MSEKPSTGHCETSCFKVEARMGLNLPPREAHGQIIDGEWRELHFERSFIAGVPNRIWNGEADKQGFLSYEAAMALAYWVAASVDASAVEIRVVEYKFVYDYTVTRVANDEPISHGAFAYQSRAQQKRELAAQK